MTTSEFNQTGTLQNVKLGDTPFKTCIRKGHAPQAPPRQAKAIPKIK
jgi:hypothetical protein